MSTDLRPAAQRLADLVADVRDDQLAGPTPCPSYTVAALLDHIGRIPVPVGPAAPKATGARPGAVPPGVAEHLADDWRTSFPPALVALGETWAEPGAQEGMTQVGGIDLPSEVCALVALDELVVHGWDLARATGQDFDPDQASL